MEELQLLLSRLQPPSDEIVHECTLISEHKDLDSLGRERGEIIVAEEEEEEGRDWFVDTVIIIVGAKRKMCVRFALIFSRV